jgi:hypothetical protein
MQKTNQTRIKKYSGYRKSILRMDDRGPQGLHRQALLHEDRLEVASPLVWLIRLLGGGVIILLILVLALIYFTR